MPKIDNTLKVFYQNLNKNHFFLVQSLQTGILVASGDILAQTAIENKRISEINLHRTSHFFILGLGLVGPALTVWYRFLSKAVTNGTNKVVVLKKVALDQFVFAPISTFVFISAWNILQGNNLTTIKKELSHKYKNIVITSYAVWPFVQIVNFYTVPLRHQVLVVQVIAVFWNSYLCWKTQQKIH